MNGSDLPEISIVDIENDGTPIEIKFGVITNVVNVEQSLKFTEEIPTEQVKVYINAIRQKEGIDYRIEKDTFIFLFENAGYKLSPDDIVTFDRDEHPELPTPKTLDSSSILCGGLDE